MPPLKTGQQDVNLPASSKAEDPLADAICWRRRAVEARALAQAMRTEHPKGIMLKVAESYDRLAEMAEQRRHAPEKG